MIWNISWWRIIFYCESFCFAFGDVVKEMAPSVFRIRDVFRLWNSSHFNQKIEKKGPSKRI